MRMMMIKTAERLRGMSGVMVVVVVVVVGTEWMAQTSRLSVPYVNE
jgi:hypothetical protein